MGWGGEEVQNHLWYLTENVSVQFFSMFMSIKGYGGYVALTWHKRKAVAFVPLKVFGFKLSQKQ